MHRSGLRSQDVTHDGRPVWTTWLASILFGGVFFWGWATSGIWISPCLADEAPKQCSRGVVIRFEGEIGPMLQQFVYRKLDTAKKQEADLIILDIDSPGGVLETSLNLAEHFRKLEWAHTVAYVPRQALSGAAIVALGCDEIVMSPDARLGDVGPIFMDENFLFQHAPEKIRSDLALQIRDLAAAAGRPPALAEAMVDRDLIVYRVQNRETDEIAFMSDAELRSADDPDQWQKIEPVFESREDHFLEVNGLRALELGLADAHGSSHRDLQERYGARDELLVLEATGMDTAVTILNSPIITGLLFVIGLVALLIEFGMPGIGLGGLTAILCFAIFFWSRFLGGTADWLEVVLFLVAIAFLGIEVFVLPGFGVAGVAGILLLITSLMLASQTYLVPQTERELASLGEMFVVILCSGTAVAVAGVGLTYYLGEIPILGRLALRPPEPKPAGTSTTDSNHAGNVSGQAAEPAHFSGVRVGDRGVADSLLAPAGKARFGDQWVDVLTEGVFVEKGRPLKVTQIMGNRIIVREIEDLA